MGLSAHLLRKATATHNLKHFHNSLWTCSRRLLLTYQEAIMKYRLLGDFWPDFVALSQLGSLVISSIGLYHVHSSGCLDFD